MASEALLGSGNQQLWVIKRKRDSKIPVKANRPSLAWWEACLQKISACRLSGLTDQAQFRNETARSGIFANIAVDQAQKTPLSIVHDSGAGLVKLLVVRMVGMCPQQWHQKWRQPAPEFNQEAANIAAEENKWRRGCRINLCKSVGWFYFVIPFASYETHRFVWHIHGLFDVLNAAKFNHQNEK